MKLGQLAQATFDKMYNSINVTHTRVAIGYQRIMNVSMYSMMMMIMAMYFASCAL